MKIALASDYDGTLFFEKKPDHFHKEDLEKIREFQKRGGLFGACTGRGLEGTLRESEGIVDFDFYIVTSGSLVLDRDQKPIFCKCIPEEIVADIVARYRDCTETKIQTNWNFYQFGPYFPGRKQISDLSEITFEHELEGYYAVACRAKSVEDGKKICAEINERYGEVVTAFQNVIDVDIVAKGTSKGDGLRRVKEYLGVDLMGGIGDSFNDIPMLAEADHAFTFPYAPQETKDHAKSIVGSVKEALEVLEKEL